MSAYGYNYQPESRSDLPVSVRARYARKFLILRKAWILNRQTGSAHGTHGNQPLESNWTANSADFTSAQHVSPYFGHHGGRAIAPFANNAIHHSQTPHQSYRDPNGPQFAVGYTSHPFQTAVKEQIPAHQNHHLRLEDPSRSNPAVGHPSHGSYPSMGDNTTARQESHHHPRELEFHNTFARAYFSLVSHNEPSLTYESRSLSILGACLASV